MAWRRPMISVRYKDFTPAFTSYKSDSVKGEQYIAGLVVTYGISNTTMLEIP